MKRWIALLTIVALVLTFAACSSNSGETAANDKEATVQADETKENTPAKDDAESGKALLSISPKPVIPKA